MRLSRLVRALSPELSFGLFHALVWLLLAVEISAGVVAPLAQGAAGPVPFQVQAR